MTQDWLLFILSEHFVTWIIVGHNTYVVKVTVCTEYKWRAKAELHSTGSNVGLSLQYAF